MMSCLHAVRCSESLVSLLCHPPLTLFTCLNTGRPNAVSACGDSRFRTTSQHSGGGATFEVSRGVVYGQRFWYLRRAQGEALYG